MNVTDQVSIKRLKQTNQLKVAIGLDTALLSECKISHLVSSRVFFTHFEGVPQTRDDGEWIQNFYIIEEYSLFSPISEKIVNN